MKHFVPEVVSHAQCQCGPARLILISMFVLIGNVVYGQDWEQLTKVVSSDRDTTRFGHAVAISGDYAIVGAWQETKDVNGNNPLPNAGAAYIFMRTGCDWNFVQKIIASDRAAQDNFGYFVDIEGDFIMVGALREDEDENGNNYQLDAGAVYVFKNISGTWTQTQKLVASDRFENDAFSVSLAISGNYAVIGAYAEDEDADGNNTVPGAGSAYVFLNTSGTWSEVQKIHATVRGGNDNFGISVAISGDYIVSGAYNEDEDADEMNTLSNAGAAYVFKNTSGTWSQVQKIVNADRATNDRFGWGVAIDGEYIVSGAPNEDEDENGLNTLNGAGSAYIFQNQSNVWTQVKKMVTSDRAALDGFGSGLAINGDYILGNCYREDEDCDGMNTLTDAGSAYMFKKVSGVWSEYQKICRNDRDAGDFFSFRVGLSGDYAVIGSHLDDHDAEDMDSLSNSGSVYFFKLGSCFTGIESVQSGDWNDPDTWNCGCVPDSTDHVHILSAHIVSVTDNQACDTLILDSGGQLNIYDSLQINGAAFFADTVYNEGTLTGDGDKLVESGGVMLTAGILAGAGELEIADGGELSSLAYVENQFYLTIRNHGVINWNAGYYTNSACGALSMIINESDGEFNIGGDQFHFFSKTNIVNYGAINVSADVSFNYGCTGDNGYFNNISPGAVNITSGILALYGDGTHSGMFNVSLGASLNFGAKMVLTTDGNVTGAGALAINDSTIINLPYTFAIDSINNSGTLTGSGNKTLPSGVHLWSAGLLSGDGELIIEADAKLTLPSFPENNFCLDITNHGTIRWSSGYYTNSLCSGISNLINASDGEFIIDGELFRYFSNMHLTNYGVINKNGTFFVTFGAEASFNNVNPGVFNINAGEINLSGNGIHSGIFDNAGTLTFNANHELTTPNNITGTGDIVISDTLLIDVPYTFPVAEITLNGTLLGMGDKALVSGGILNMNGVWNVAGELEIQDGAVLNYNGGFLSDSLRNHGTVNWPGNNLNACGELCTFINASDGEFVITGGGNRYLARTSLTNYGMIIKTGDANVYLVGGCGNDGTFNNTSPGIVENQMGYLEIAGNGTHSGSFSNSGVLAFNANHELTTDGNLTGTGELRFHDTMIINIPYTFPAATIGVYGVLIGTGHKTLPSGAVLNMYNTWNVVGETEIQDGAIFNYAGLFLSNMVRNHGTFNWNAANVNACGTMSDFINEADGEFNIANGGVRYLSRTNLTNYGLITKSADANVIFNDGCGGDGTFSNITPGVFNNNALGTLELRGDGTHNGSFNNNSGILIFAADHALTMDGNLTGGGEIQFHDTMIINIPYTFPAAFIGVYGVVTGTGDKTLPSGSVLALYNTWNVDGETEIMDGAQFNYSGQFLSNMVRNHGTFNWNAYNMNACGEMSSFINESDGEFNIAAGGYFSRTNLVNSGIITKTSNNQIYMNGGCGDDGTFENNTPGVVNILDGEFHLFGDGDHSGIFNNSGLLNFNADHELTTPDNITGSGDIQVHDTVIINVPYNFPAANIRVEGTVIGTGNKVLPSGTFLDLYGRWEVDGETTIQDGATLDYQGTHIFNMIRNHGVVNWNANSWNACGALSDFINEADGIFNIPDWGERYLARTNLTNYGLINKTGTDIIYFNSGCGGDGIFVNLGPGELNIASGLLNVH